MDPTSELVGNAGWGLNNYNKEARLYNLASDRFPALHGKIFQEKDIPIQVAIGNYDLGVCGTDWIQELIVKYPSSNLVKIMEFDYGKGFLSIASSNIPGVQNKDNLRIASEYPNLAEYYAAKKRIKCFSIFPLWGAAEVYPPESSDYAVISDTTIDSDDLITIDKILDFRACLVANRKSWETKDMSSILESLREKDVKAVEQLSNYSPKNTLVTNIQPISNDKVRIALPDGHQQKPTIEVLKKAGILVEEYFAKNGNRRPECNLQNVAIKVIRPQDMPLQVANGNFDLAITGKDWLTNHLDQFPTSPVSELLDLKYGKVRIVAAISNNVQANKINELRDTMYQLGKPIRVASEYVNIADKYARDHHLGVYQIIPTWGASESFVPDDADVLIENTETGTTLARHNLKIIDTLFESTGCVIGSKDPQELKKTEIDNVIKMIQGAMGG